MSLGKTLRHKRRALYLVPLLGGALLAGCGNGSSGGGGQSGVVGTEIQKVNSTETFFVDPNESGRTRRLTIEELSWGRLVDVHQVTDDDPMIPPSLRIVDFDPVYRDFLVGQDILSDLVNYRLETNPLTNRARLVILRERDNPEFRQLLDAAADAVQVITPKHDDGTSARPFPLVPRNAGVSLRFNDVLKDGPSQQASLIDDVLVFTGYRPTTPYDARVIFDRHHGGMVRGDFHSSRVIVDLTISDSEAATMPVPVPVNTVGLPPSSQIVGSRDPNVSIHIPSDIRTSAGQFTRLESLSGFGMDQNVGFVASNPTLDIVRAFRSGNSTDANNGFLSDVTPPQLLGTWPVILSNAVDDPTGTVGFDFLVDVQFTTVCQNSLSQRDVLELGSVLLEVVNDTADPDGSGLIQDVRVRSLADVGIPAGTLFGGGSMLSPFELASPVPDGCWISFTPLAAMPPVTDVATNSQVMVRFTEPMDPASMTALDTFTVVEGDTSVEGNATNTVVGIVLPSPDRDAFSFVSSLPFSHTNGMAEDFHVDFARLPRDLAGNDVMLLPPKIGFTIDATEPTVITGGISFRFESTDEMGFAGGGFTGDPDGRLDVRGQILYDTANGTLRGRDVQFASYPTDQNLPMQAAMAQIGGGVTTPLNPLGAKLQTVWRYCDFGWVAADETKHNLDIIGLNWVPLGGAVSADFFKELEISIAHSSRLPDEARNQNGSLTNPSGGLLPAPSEFVDNVLLDTSTPRVVVNPRSVGYQVSPVNRFAASTSTIMMPFPFNRGAGAAPFLWRDTASLAVGDSDLNNNGGIPLAIEGLVSSTGLGTDPVPENAVANGDPIPTIALPLLVEYRCYPSTTAIGLNVFDVRQAVSNRTIPGFRTLSIGGTDASGTQVRKDPDTEFVPSGGFNPLTGTPTGITADNIFYFGQIDTVVRVSRAHTIWLDTVQSPTAIPVFALPIVEPDPQFRPAGSSFQLHFRGADDFQNEASQPSEIPFDAVNLQFYGELRKVASQGQGGTVVFRNDDSTWTNDITDLDGARYLQVRLTFVNNTGSGLGPEVSALGIPFEIQ